MKKLLILLLFIVTFSVESFSQNKEYYSIYTSTVPLENKPDNVYYEQLALGRDGIINFYRGNYYKGEDKSGVYYISNNVIYITWDNGHKEQASLSYSSDGKAIIKYNGKTLYEKFVPNY